MHNENVTRIIAAYPPAASEMAGEIRRLIHRTGEREGFPDVAESLKWGEPSFAVPGGSPFRMDWKDQTPDTLQIYFNCRTSLVDTFRTIHGSALEFEGTRAIRLPLDRGVPVEALEHCFSLAMRYHALKGIPLLGE